jgi:hypothetical protein
MPARHHRFHLLETSCGGPDVACTWPLGTVGGAGASPRPAAAGGSAWVNIVAVSTFRCPADGSTLQGGVDKAAPCARAIGHGSLPLGRL